MNYSLPDFSKAKVLVIGDIMLDRYWFGDAARISPEAPVPVINVKQQDERPGGAANVALNIATLGAKTHLFGITGNDEAATTLQKQLTAANIHHSIQMLSSIPTITKLRIISRHQQLIRMDFEEKFPDYSAEELLNQVKQQLTDCQLMILSDYGKGTLKIARELIQLARDVGVPTLVDPKGKDFSIYANATIITPNFKEFETIVGPCENEQMILQKSRELLKQFNIDNLLLTRGENGMTLIPRHEDEIHLPAHARQVFDVTGAGDTVIGVLGAALAAGSPLPDAMSMANLAASLVVAKLGAGTVSVPEMQATLSQHTAIHTGVMNEDQLLFAVSEARLKGKRIVFTNGCFDILHAGHVTYLQQAKQLGDYLIVAINNDESVKRLKGSGRPINSVEQRLAVLASLGVVDSVVSFADDTPERLLKRLQPDILVKGGDYTTDQVVGANIVRAYGGDVRVLGVIKNLSTTAIINRAAKQQT